MQELFRVYLARVLAALGEHTEARILLEHLVAAEERAHPEGSRKLAMYLHALADVHRAQGDLPTARSLVERSLLINNRIFGTDEHPEVAVSLHELARVFRAQGDLPTARSLAERSLLIKQKLLGTEHPEVAASLHELALVLHSQGDFLSARSLLEHSLLINKTVLGTEEHHNVATIYVNLAVCLGESGLLDESEDAFRKALAIYERAYRTRNHYMIAEAEAHLSILLFIRGHQEEARHFRQHALSVLQAQAPSHPLLLQFQQFAPGLPVDLNHLARSVLTVRRAGIALPEELSAGLHSLRSAGELHNRVADFLEQLAHGGPLPPVPPGLPEDAAAFVASVRQAAEAPASQP